MPKMKTHSGTAKRFKLTGTGKSSQVTRRLAGPKEVAPSDRREIKKLLGK